MTWLTRTLSKDKKGKKGFTLIELMIVVIVVAVLAAAAIPLYRRSVQKARATEGMALLGTIRTHYLVYSAEHPGVLPTAPAATDVGLLAWGIDVSTNRWWKDFSLTPGPTIDWTGLPDVVIDAGSNTDLVGINLTMECDTGVLIEDYT